MALTLLLAAAAALERGALARQAALRILDGDLGDWAAGEVAAADGRYLHLRVETPVATALQGGRHSLRILIDLDDDGDTGRAVDGLGADLEILFGPSGSDGTPRPGVRLSLLERRGRALEIDPTEAGLGLAPVHAATAHEIRLDRRAKLPQPFVKLWRTSTGVRGNYRFVTAGAESDGVARAFQVELPALDRTEAQAPFPARPPEALRLVSWNVERAAPRDKPEPFARILKALEPDVLLLQEWWGATEEELLAWLSAHLPSATPWRAAAAGRLGVAVASRLPLVSLLEEPVKSRGEDGREHPVRFVPALLETDGGLLLVGSVHLKAFGGEESTEDRIRAAQALAVNARLKELLDQQPRAALLVAGDFNLVGTRAGLELLARGLDSDGSDLDPLEALVEGERSAASWRKAGSFCPGRLDYALLAQAARPRSRAVLFDSALIAHADLAARGIRAEDSLCSDHRPLVIDLLAGEGALPPLVPATAEELLARVREPGTGPVLVNFWATWCVPCVAEMNDLLAVHREFEQRGLRLFLVSCDFPEEAQAARRLLAAKGVHFETYIKTGKDDPFIRAIHEPWEGTIPATFVIGADGRIIHFHQGRASYQEFRSMVLDALGERPSRPDR